MRARAHPAYFKGRGGCSKKKQPRSRTQKWIQKILVEGQDEILNSLKLTIIINECSWLGGLLNALTLKNVCLSIYYSLVRSALSVRLFPRCVSLSISEFLVREIDCRHIL